MFCVCHFITLLLKMKKWLRLMEGVFSRNLKGRN
nr:MAG TPA: hypothetical protein [Caudoviricetes sp.]